MFSSSQLPVSLRPTKLSDIQGQPAIVKTLINQIRDRKLPKALLFKGPSGTGKTSLALIVAMTVNCTKLNPDLSPCGECPSCRDIKAKRFNRDTKVLKGNESSGKDDILDFSRQALIPPQDDRFSVYIIEEADQLSAQAKKSLLTVLEEPSEHVFFILLSMEDKGLPPAILDRCFNYPIKTLTIKESMSFLRETLIKLDKWDILDIPKSFYLEVLPMVAEASRGSIRALVQHLEQCLVGECWTVFEASQVLEMPDLKIVTDALELLLNRDPKFFEVLDSFDSKKFFDDSYQVLGNALKYKLLETAHDTTSNSYLKKLSTKPLLMELLSIYDAIQSICGLVFKDAVFRSKIGQFAFKKERIYD